MRNNSPYTGGFHNTRHQETNYAAEKILRIILDSYPTISSAIDVGCGVGTFLLFLEREGISDVLGLDGNWVSQDLLVLPFSKFRAVDLIEFPEIDRVFDLAICLEVAEHLPPQNARKFIEKLCNLSDVILFSAAVPGQGGVSHLNEAWQSYWAKLFSELSYFPIDIIRPKIWNDSAIPWWYRQNTFVYMKRSIITDQYCDPFPMDIIHPELFLLRSQNEEKSPDGFDRIKRVVKRIVKKCMFISLVF